MHDSLKKAHARGLLVRELCISDAFRSGQWIHRDGVIFAAVDCQADIHTLWPTATHSKPLGILSDVPEIQH